MGSEEEEVIFNHRESTQCQTTETTNLTKNEVRVIISKNLSAKGIPRYDLITCRILEELPKLDINYLLDHSII